MQQAYQKKKRQKIFFVDFESQFFAPQTASSNDQTIKIMINLAEKPKVKKNFWKLEKGFFLNLIFLRKQKKNQKKERKISVVKPVAQNQSRKKKPIFSNQATSAS